MALRTRLTPKQTQQLRMTPQLRQAIELLQMSSFELQKFIDDEAEKNPLLETEAAQQKKPADPPLRDDIRSFSKQEYRAPGYHSSDGKDFLMENLAGALSLRQHLMDQLSLSGGSFETVSLARILVHELDDDGYLRTDLREIAARVGANMTSATEALELLQSCEPTGVGARNLQECFALQLRERGELTETASRFLETMDEIAAMPRKARWAEMGIDAETYSELLTTVKSLRAAPGSAFDQGFTEYAIPDVSVFRNNLGGWSVELNGSNLPTITINRQLAKEVAVSDGDAAKYVADCRRRADWLVRSIEQRSMTILKVAAEIVRVQEPFFSMGVSHLRPLTMREVAEKVKINESTVSRVTNSKYLSCERGTFELKFFFSKAIQMIEGAPAVSSASIQEKIRRLIDDEDASKVLSDDKIRKILRESGADIARRTVTKYREGMNIPSSVERRRQKLG